MFNYLKYKLKLFICLFLFFLVFVFTFFLYSLPVKAVIYPSLLCFVIGLVFLGFDCFKTHKTVSTLEIIKKIDIGLIDELPSPQNIQSESYNEIIRLLCESHAKTVQKGEKDFEDMVNYYTLWAHQIKTPISSMRLNLQNEDTPLSRTLQNDLTRIESYVNMVLAFLRLNSSSTDYVFKEYNLDNIIKDSVKKFSGEFITKKLSLSFEETNTFVLTDEKWLSFAVEQIISNSIKYTETGGVSIYLENPKILCIRDTGIGIMDTDLPRVFENGYTGLNGRTDKRASGIGLFLCKQICNNLSHKIEIFSKVGEGTTVKIHLDSKTVVPS